VTWVAPQKNTSSITDYIVQYSSDGGQSWTTFDDVVSSSTSTTVTGLSNNGTSYVFRVKAKNSAGTSGYSTVSQSITVGSNNMGGGSNMGSSGPDCSTYINGASSLSVSFDLAKYNADHGRASCNCGGSEIGSIGNSLSFEGYESASWRVDMTWCSSDGSGGQSISVIGVCSTAGYKYTVSVSSVGGTESSGDCDVSYTTSTPLAPPSPNWPDTGGNLYMKVYDTYLKVSAPRAFDSSCPSGYQRLLACEAPSEPGYNPDMMLCGYSTQINCYSSLYGDIIPNTTSQRSAGQNCVSYCDNI